MVYLQSQMTVVHIINVALMPLALKAITTILPVNVIIHEVGATATVNSHSYLTRNISLKIISNNVQFHSLKMKIISTCQFPLALPKTA